MNILPTNARYLIVNADDFGLTVGVNRGIIRAREKGIVTSASLMVRGEAALEAGAYARSHRWFDVGLHFDIAEWAYEPNGWEIVYQVVDPEDPVAVERELDRQVDVFCTLVGTKPTHVDSHQHVHRSPSIASVVTGVAARLGVPLRETTASIQYCGSFYGADSRGEPFPESITVDSLCAIINALPPGVTELACHPGEGEAEQLPVHYGSPRVIEMQTLCDPAVRAALARSGVILTTFTRFVEFVAQGK